MAVTFPLANLAQRTVLLARINRLKHCILRCGDSPRPGSGAHVLALRGAHREIVDTIAELGKIPHTTPIWAGR
jgi:hypothetical protein